jgi:hypothetical protein
MDKVIFVSNRRLARRHNLAIHLRFRVLRSNVPEQRAESVNVSEGGVYFATELAVQKGAAVQLLMKMPEEITGKPTIEWRATGHVVRVQPIPFAFGRIGVGVRFDCYEIVPPADLLTA